MDMMEINGDTMVIQDEMILSKLKNDDFDHEIPDFVKVARKMEENSLLPQFKLEDESQTVSQIQESVVIKEALPLPR